MYQGVSGTHKRRTFSQRVMVVLQKSMLQTRPPALFRKSDESSTTPQQCDKPSKENSRVCLRGIYFGLLIRYEMTLLLIKWNTRTLQDYFAILCLPAAGLKHPSFVRPPSVNGVLLSNEQSTRLTIQIALKKNRKRFPIFLGTELNEAFNTFMYTQNGDPF